MGNVIARGGPTDQKGMGAIVGRKPQKLQRDFLLQFVTVFSPEKKEIMKNNEKMSRNAKRSDR